MNTELGMRDLRTAVHLLILMAIGNVAYAQISGEVSVEVTEADGLYTYEYTVTNSLVSSVSINYFFVDVVPGATVVEGTPAEFGARSLESPDGWVGQYSPFELLLNDDFIAIGIRTDSLTGEPEFLRDDVQEVNFFSGDGNTLDDDSADIFEGDSRIFRIQSFYAPGEQTFEVGKLSPLFETLGAFDGSIEAPTVPPMGTTGPDCDFSGDGVCDLVDIDLLGFEIAAGTNGGAFDLTGDGVVSTVDLDAFLANENVQKINGDADFSGDVGFLDFLTLANNFGNENVAWSGGNFVPDGSVAFTDFLTLANNFGKSFEGGDAAAASVPEPSATTLLIAGLIGLLPRRLRREQ